MTTCQLVAYLFLIKLTPLVSSETIARFLTDKLLLTVPIVLYSIFQYLYLVYHRNYGGNPAHALLTDGPLRLSIVLWGLVSALILYTAHL